MQNSFEIRTESNVSSLIRNYTATIFRNYDNMNIEWKRHVLAD